MEKSTRNTIQRATQVARELLESEFREQLEGTFDILLDGNIADQPGSHLSETQKVVRTKLISAIDHISASGPKPKEAVDAYLREAAFTTLNRFVALKMLEARELVQECISKGEESSGYKEYAALAPGLVALDDHGYRAYIESIFDEIGREVRVLFDRRDPASLLWPRRQALQKLLDVLNAPELSSVWIEDETIGWVYQYFNGEDERKKMREESQAPRNSRELAVRNQFFTPRYVVQFLVDNTLGRAWFEMMRGETSLKELDYLVRRQHEVFPDEGAATPVEPEGVNFGETPDNLFPVPYRAKKDPRDLKILDPACGSGHFLLYTFDLLLTIYEEAWQDESSKPSEESGSNLRTDFKDLSALRCAVPELILRHNLHGIDIDARAAQIAALALWLRAQRAYQEANVFGDQRPAITKTNVVVAEPMPGEAELRKSFVECLEGNLGRLVEMVFDHMDLAGEAGYLLRIAESVEDSIRTLSTSVGGLFRESEESAWSQVAKDLRIALESFVKNAVGSQIYNRQLFVEDAAQCLGFIDICSQHYDAVLMNPPFGLATPRVFEYLQDNYEDTYVDIYSAFVSRGVEVSPNGIVGAITSRSFLTSKKLERWRRAQLVRGVSALVDLGSGVMDNALVDSAAYTVTAGLNYNNPITAFDLRPVSDKNRELKLALDFRNDVERRYSPSRQLMEDIPGSKLLYFLSEELAGLMQENTSFEPHVGTVRKGLTTFDDFRFLRLRWEVPNPGKDGWDLFAKGGEYSNYYTDIHLCINRTKDAGELAERNRAVNGQTAQSRQGSSYYYRPGCQYTGRSAKGFSARAIPAGCVMSSNAPLVLSESGTTPGYILGWLNSRLIRSLIEMQAIANDFVPGIVKGLPWSPPEKTKAAKVEELVDRIWELCRQWNSLRETDIHFSCPMPLRSIPEALEELDQRYSAFCSEIAGLQREITQIIDQNYKYDSECLAEEVLQRSIDTEITLEVIDPVDYGFSVASYALGVALGRWDIEKRQDPKDLRQDPFDKIGNECPRILFDGKDIRAAAPQPDHPIEISSQGILVDDPGGNGDLMAHISEVFSIWFNDPAASMEEMLRLLDKRNDTLREWYANKYFAMHIKLYSKSRRKAPVYWQLSTPSASFSTWLYYHRISRDTLFRVLNDYVTPKLQHEERQLTNLTQVAGPDPSANQRKQIAAQEVFVEELQVFRDEVARVAPLWNPNLNDGVILNFAPLWRLVPQHKSWQKECKKIWDKLCKGDFDWAHIAMHLWPERVVPKCGKDRSLAIAHGLDDAFWQEDVEGKWRARKVGSVAVEQLIAERTVPAVKSALDDLTSAPAPAGGRRRRTRS